MVDIASSRAASPRTSARPERAPRRGPSGRIGFAARRPTPEPRATIEEWLRIPEEMRAELIAGRIVYHACPSPNHGNAQVELQHFLRPYKRRRQGSGGGGDSPGAAELGGWWISQEVDMAIADVGCRPDVVGWRRDKHARLPQADSRGVVVEAPDFVCEVLSAPSARYDLGAKREAYFRASVPYYWLVDPRLKTLTVLERTDRGYLIVRFAGPGETVRAAPFEGVEIPLDELFLDEEGELPAAQPEKPAAEIAKGKGRGPARAAKKSGTVAKKRSPHGPG